MGKSHKLHFPNSETNYTRPLQLVESNFWGPSPILSSVGFKYYITFVDVYSRFTWIYFLRRKLEALETFIHFKTKVENTLNTLKILDGKSRPGLGNNLDSGNEIASASFGVV